MWGASFMDTRVADSAYNKQTMNVNKKTVTAEVM